MITDIRANIRNLVIHSSMYNYIRNRVPFRVIITSWNIRKVNLTIGEIVDEYDVVVDGARPNLGFEDMITITEYNNNFEIIEVVDRNFGRTVLRLEHYVNLINRIRNLNLGNIDELSRDISLTELAQISSMNYEQVNELIDRYENGDETLCRQLAFLARYYQTWIAGNGLNVTEMLLRRAITASVCQASRRNFDDIRNFHIRIPKIHNIINRLRYLVTFNNPETGREINYYININSGILYTSIVQFEFISNLINCINNQSNDNPNFDEILQACLVGINCAKTSLGYIHDLTLLFRGLSLGDYYDFENDYVETKLSSGRSAQLPIRRYER